MTAFFQWQEADRNYYELFYHFASFIHGVSRNCKHPIKQIICFQNYYQSCIIQKPHGKSFCSIFFQVLERIIFSLETRKELVMTLSPINYSQFTPNATK